MLIETLIILTGLTALTIYIRQKLTKSNPIKVEQRNGNIARSKNQISMKKSKKLFLWGGHWLSFKEACQHFLAIGSTGSGKSVTIKLLLKSVLPQLLKEGSNARVLIYDSKTDLLSTISGILNGFIDREGKPDDRIINMHPLDSRNFAWDMSADLTNNFFMDQAAADFIAAPAGENDPFWTNSARILLSGVMKALNYASPGNWTLRDILQAIETHENMRRILLSCPETESLHGKFFEPQKTFQSIASHLYCALENYRPIAAAWEEAIKEGRKISIRQWTACTGDEHYHPVLSQSVMVLGNHPEAEEGIKRLNQILFTQIAKQILAKTETEENENAQNWIFLDETRECGKLTKLQNMLGLGRSKKCAIVLGFQDIAGMDQVYGKEMAREMIGNIGNVSILHINSLQPESQQFAADCVGKGEFIVTTEGDSNCTDAEGKRSNTVSHNVTRSLEEVYLPSQFGNPDLLPLPSMKNGLCSLCRVGALWYESEIEGNIVFGDDHSNPGRVPEPNNYRDFVANPVITEHNPELPTITPWEDADKTRLAKFNLQMETVESKEQPDKQAPLKSPTPLADELKDFRNREEDDDQNGAAPVPAA